MEYKITATLTKEVNTTFTDDGKTELADLAHDALSFDFDDGSGNIEFSDFDIGEIKNPRPKTQPK